MSTSLEILHGFEIGFGIGIALFFTLLWNGTIEKWLDKWDQ